MFACRIVCFLSVALALAVPAAQAANHPDLFRVTSPDFADNHFLWLVFAGDIAPGVLKPGLAREQFMQHIQGHNLAEASLFSIYQR